MGYFDFLIKQKKPKKGDAQFFSKLLQGSSEINQSEQNDEAFIEEGFRNNPTVNSIVSMTMKTAGLAKWGIYKKNKDNTLEPYNDVLLQSLLDRPNGLGTWDQLIQDTIMFKMVTGNAYIWGIKGENDLTKGTIGSLYALPSQYVQINVSANRKKIDGYNIEYYGRNKEDMIPADEVYHFKTGNPNFNVDGDFLYGQSPLKAAMQSLRTNNDCIVTANSYLLNQGPRGILTMEQNEEYGSMSEEQQDGLRRRFERQHTGTKKAGQLLVAPGKWKWENIGSSSADLKLLEHYKSTMNDLCNVYNFPTVLLSDGETAFANGKEAKKALWTNVTIPHLEEIKEGLNKWLVPYFGEDIVLDYSLKDVKELQEDIKSQAEAINKLQGVVTVNEARAMIGKAPLTTGGDELYIFTQGVVDDKPKENGDS